MPSSARPPLMVSRVEIILAVRAGLRKPVQMTIWPMRTRRVSAASAESDVKGSKTISWAGTGTVWKWSYSQTESNPRRSACWATATVRAQAASGRQPRYSMNQPCGTTSPMRIGSYSDSR